ncbi:MAG: hypothetical protein [Caudoviricetes sp.]|nr:MAG: hypothetical protein [Caudoviricetes sp.]
MLSDISNYIHARGLDSAPVIIDAYFRTGRINHETRDWLYDVWGVK